MTQEQKYIKLAIKKGYKSTKDGNIVGLRGYNLSLHRKKGYCRFTINVGKPTSGSKNNKYRSIFVHRFIAFEKFGNELFKEGIVARHLDNNSLNNSWDNIAIGTPSDNMMDIPEDKRSEMASNRKYNYEEIKSFHNGLYSRTMTKFNISSKGTLHYILNS